MQEKQAVTFYTKNEAETEQAGAELASTLPVGAVVALYGDLDELFDIGWEDYLRRGGVCAVEWSENVADAFEGDEITVRIEKLGDEERKITIGEGE